MLVTTASRRVTPQLVRANLHLHSTTSAPAARLARGFAASAAATKERLVVLGSGWGGYNLARKVDKKLYDVTVISPNSYFSFTPFLASTCVGTLEFRCATEPVRGIKHVNFAQGWADQIDYENKTVRVEPTLPPIRSDEPTHKPKGIGAEFVPECTPADSYSLPYDKLVIATGCRSASFGTPGVEQHAHFLKDVREARAIRLRLLQCLEMASEPTCTPEDRRRLLSFRIVGGGPTGVEFAAELHDFVVNDVYRLYPHLKDQVEITLYDVAKGILMSFDSALREYAERKFSRDGVRVQGDTKITAVGPDWLELNGNERVPFGLLVWSTGIMVNPFVKDLPGLQKDQKSLLKVDKNLRVIDESGKAMPDVFAIGDNATPADGHRLPATAQVASQMAAYMSRQLNSLGKGVPATQTGTFDWKNMGSMVFIGDHRAMVDRSADNTEGPKSRLAGFAAWVVWRSYYMTLAMGWRNKLLIPMYWALAFFWGRDITSF